MFRQISEAAEESMDDSVRPLVALFKQSYLRPQAAGTRNAARIGHENEEPFLKSFFDLCSEQPLEDPYSFACLDPVAVARPGLLRKKGSKFAKASLDGAAFLKTTDEYGDDNIEVVPVEIKSRVATATMSAAQSQIEDVVGAEEYDAQSKYLIKASSRSELVGTLLHDRRNPSREKKEAFQLLHGAYVCGSSKGLMLIGSATALMYGIHITFEEELLEAYDLVMRYMYDEYFKDFYELPASELKEQLSSRVESAVEYLDFMDSHAFWMNYKLWRSLNVDVVEANTKFPLPPAARLIPMQMAYWNVLKGPSDTTTKLLDNVEEKIGVRVLRTLATGRILLLQAVAFHRTIQALTAQRDGKIHATLLTYRNSANKRFDMSSRVALIAKKAMAERDSLLAANTRPRASVVATNVTPPPRALRGEQRIERREWCCEYKSPRGKQDHWDRPTKKSSLVSGGALILEMTSVFHSSQETTPDCHPLSLHARLLFDLFSPLCFEPDKSQVYHHRLAAFLAARNVDLLPNNLAAAS